MSMGNRKKRKIRICLIVVLLCMAACIWGFFVYRVNKRIPQVKTTVYEGDEWVDWKNGVEIMAEDIRFMEDEAIRSGKDVEDYMVYPFEMKLLWATVSLKNTGREPTKVSLLELGVESPGWSNIPDPQFYYALGERERETSFELKAGEQVKVELPYLMVKINFRNSEWKKIEEKEYHITFTLYPEKKMISLPFKERM